VRAFNATTGWRLAAELLQFLAAHEERQVEADDGAAGDHSRPSVSPCHQEESRKRRRKQSRTRSWFLSSILLL
jgi:hypothetical protein